jgi:hypothetical protein
MYLSRQAGTRRLLAAVFVLFFLAEFGSHAVICSGEHSGGGPAISSADRGHEDPCTTLIQCGYDQNNRQAPKLGHDAAQHNALFDRLFELSAANLLLQERPIATHQGVPLFCPKDPPFHPPKQA